MDKYKEEEWRKKRVIRLITQLREHILKYEVPVVVHKQEEENTANIQNKLLQTIRITAEELCLTGKEIQEKETRITEKDLKALKILANNEEEYQMMKREYLG